MLHFVFTISICWIWYHCQLKQWITTRKKLYSYCISLYYIIEFDGQLKSIFAYFSGFWSRAPVCVSVQTAPCPVYLLDSNRAALCDPIDGSLPGSPIPGILQARTLEWVAISFSSAWKWKVKVKSLSRVQLLATPWIPAYQAPPSMWFSRQEYWSGVPLPSLILP